MINWDWSNYHKHQNPQPLQNACLDPRTYEVPVTQMTNSVTPQCTKAISLTELNVTWGQPNMPATRSHPDLLEPTIKKIGDHRRSQSEHRGYHIQFGKDKNSTFWTWCRTFSSIPSDQFQRTSQNICMHFIWQFSDMCINHKAQYIPDFRIFDLCRHAAFCYSP